MISKTYPDILKLNTRSFLPLLLSLAGYVVILYFIPRTNFVFTYSLIIILCLSYYSIIKNKSFTIRQCIIMAVLFRLIAVFSMPALSDDYFRFIWDGEMAVRHINPFAYTPDVFVQTDHDAYLNFLHDRMNSAAYYTVYPPVLQYIFHFSVNVFKQNVYGAIVTLKVFIFIAECGTMYFLYQLLKFKKQDTRNILWYLLNPLVIIELTGNVHFEAFLILFLIATIYFLEQQKMLAAGVFWALAICSKFLPLMLAPLFLMYSGFNKFLKFGIIALITVLLLFYPFIDNSLLNIKDSLGKFYDLFEFNAGIYYFIKVIGSYFTQNDISDYVAKSLGILACTLILVLSFYRFKKEELIIRTLFIFSLYLFTTTMVHPWYITTLVALCCFTKFKYPVVFALLIPLSYFPYSLQIFEENMEVIFVEYFVLFFYMYLEFRRRSY